MQRELGLRAARIWERLSDDQRAETRYQTVLDQESDNQDALSSLERIYRQRGDSTLLAEMLLRRAQLELNSTKRRRCCRKRQSCTKARWRMSLRPSKRGRRSWNSTRRTARRCRLWLTCISAPVALTSWCRSAADAGSLKQRQGRPEDRRPGSHRRAVLRGAGPVGAGHRGLPRAARAAAQLAQGAVGAGSASTPGVKSSGRWCRKSCRARLKAVQGGREDKVAVLRKLAQLSLEKLQSVG
jgi:hypothetical protein